jgi:hypothetical protein
MQLLDILNAVLGQSGFIEKTAFTSSADLDDKQMIAIANRVVQDMVEFCEWSPLIKEEEIQMFAGIDPSGDPLPAIYPLPGDFLSFVSNSAWELDGSKPLELPVPLNRWFMYKYSTLGSGGLIRSRLIYDRDSPAKARNTPGIYAIEIAEGNLPGEKFVLQFKSNSSVYGSDNSYKQYFTSDDDQFLLDDQTLIKGIQAEWARAKMMPQAGEWKQEALMALNQAKGRDTGARTIGGFAVSRRYPVGSPYYPLWRS